MSPASPSRSPRWYGVPARVLLITFLGTLLSFTVSLLLAILGTVVVAAARGVHPDMRVAYRNVAIPMAMVAACLILILATVMEVRHYRQAKSLAALERMS